MGNNLLTALTDMFYTTPEARVLMLGLDAAGKTTISEKLKFDECRDTLPTIGFNVQNFKFNKVNINLWDIGGQSKIRNLWRHYYQGTDVLIFVVDSSDRKRLQLARRELMATLSASELDDVDVLVLANKQDLGVMSVEEVIEGMGLRELVGRNWYCQGCSGTTGSGLFEGFSWLSKRIRQKKR